MGNSPGQQITIPDNEVIRDEDVQRDEGGGQQQPSQPSWAGRAWNTAKNVLGLDEGVLFGGSGEAAGVGGAPRTVGEAATPLTYPAFQAAGELAGPYLSKMLPSWGKEAPSFFERDATHLNKVPFAGEEIPEGEGPATSITNWPTQPQHAAVRAGQTQVNRLGARGVVPVGESPAPVASGGEGEEAGEIGGNLNPFRAPKKQGDPFALPTRVPEKSSMPGAGGESWSMQRKVTPQLQQAASAGDPGAISTMRRLNPTWSPIVIPKGAEIESPSMESIRAAAGPSWQSTSTQAPISSPTASQGPSGGLPQGRPNLFEIASPMESQPTLRQPVQELASRRNYGPEFESQQREEMISRYKDILRNPSRTAEDEAEAQARLKELGAVQ